MKRQILFFALLFVGVSAFAQEIFREDFEGTDVPMGWTQTTTGSDGGFKVGSTTALGSQYFTPTNPGSNIILTNDDGCNCNKSAERLMSPSYDLTGYSYLAIKTSIVFPGGFGETASFSASSDGGATWTPIGDVPAYLSIDFNDLLVNLSDFAGQSDVMIALDYNDNGQWAYGVGMDYFSIVEVPAVDAAAVEVVADAYAVSQSAVDASFILTNNGGATITALSGTVTFNGMATPFSVDGLSIGAFSEGEVNTGVSLTLPSNDPYDIEVAFDMVNGVADSELADNTVMATTIGVSRAPKHPLIAEEATGTWCQWCPRGAVFMDLMENDYPDDFIAIAVHGAQNDPMEYTPYIVGLDGIAGGLGFPSVGISRAEFVNPSDMPDLIQDVLEEVVPFDVTLTNIELDTATRVLTGDLTVEVLSNLTTNMNLAYVITEDEVTGTGSLWAQVNAYSGGNNGPMGGYENLPNPVPAEDMVYEFVARTILPSFEGEAVASTTYTAGDVVTRSIEIELPITVSDVNHLNFIALVMDSDGLLLNGTEQVPTFKEVSSTRAPKLSVEVSAFPNPATDVLNVRAAFATSTTATFTLSSLLGQVVSKQVVSGSDINTTINVADLAAGQYQLTVSTNEGLRTMSVTVQ